MAFWKKKNYCEFCGSEKNKDGTCPNPKCIKYKTEKQDVSKKDDGDKT